MNRNDFPTKNKLDSKQTAANGTDWTAFDAEPCYCARIHNSTGVTIDFRLNGGGDSVSVPAYQVRTIYGITDASQVSMRRNDTSTTQVTVGLEALG